MARQVCKYWVIAGLLFFPALVPAQEYSGWRLYHAEGNIVLTSRGSRTIYKSGSSDFEGTALKSQDMIQTGSGGAEIQIIPENAGSGEYTVLKLGENTSLLINSLGADLSLELLYGRIRAVSGTAAPNLAIRSGNSLSSFRNGDAALDFVTRPGQTQPALAIHCFRGQGELTPLVQTGSADISKLPIKNGETLRMEYHIPFSYVERKALDQEALAYWTAHQFAGSAPLAMPGVELAQAPVTEIVKTPADAIVYEPPAFSAGEDARKIKNGYIITGLLLVSAGAAMQGYSFFGNPGPELRDRLFYGGYGPLGLGAVFLFGAAAYNPD
ncbi:MAG: hypothetical protein LBC31_06790 [Treponema sp.]|jgi:hypothetical protein|nr:hypothetical protein [Treponema sp.]